MLGALERQESRGAHNRRDHPDLDDAQLCSYEITDGGSGDLRVAARPIPPIPDELREFLPAGGQDLPERLLE